MSSALAAQLILLRIYDRQALLHDLSAGVTAGLLALPLAMAFTVASSRKENPHRN